MGLGHRCKGTRPCTAWMKRPLRFSWCCSRTAVLSAPWPACIWANHGHALYSRLAAFIKHQHDQSFCWNGTLQVSRSWPNQALQSGSGFSACRCPPAECIERSWPRSSTLSGVCHAHSTESRVPITPPGSNPRRTPSAYPGGNVCPVVCPPRCECSQVEKLWIEVDPLVP